MILHLVRIGLPAAIAAAGVALVGVALVVLLFNLFLRLGASSSRDREREEEAREQYDRTGRWPDDG